MRQVFYNKMRRLLQIATVHTRLVRDRLLIRF